MSGRVERQPATAAPVAVLRRTARRLLRRLYEGRFTLRVMALTAVAAGVAWALCIPMGNFAPAFAVASAVYAVQLTLGSSLRDGVRRSGLMALSVLLAVVILRTVGLSVPAVVILVFVSMATSRLAGLGARASVQIPATAIFVLALGTSVTGWTLLARVLGTFVGSIVGAVASVAAHAGDPQGHVRQAIAGIARATAQLLDDMASGLDKGLMREDARRWLARSRRLDADTGKEREFVDEAVAFLHWDPFGRKGDADELARAYASIEHSVIQVRDIARSLFEASVSTRRSVLADSLVPVLEGTAAAFRSHAAQLEGGGPNLDIALEAVRKAGRDSLGWVRRADDTGIWLASGHILTDVERMVQQLEGSTPALDVPAGDTGPRRPARRPRRRTPPPSHPSSSRP